MFHSIMNRRRALQTIALGTSAAFVLTRADNPKRKMTINLMCGMIGVRANQREAVDLAHRHGFESVEAMANELAKMSGDDLKALRDMMHQKNVVLGAAGLPVDFRSDDSRFLDGMRELPKIAEGLQRAGVKRMGTWISPGHNSLTYRRNFDQHADRLRQVARVLRDHDVRLGLEYVGTRTLRDRYRYHFIYSMAETRELIAAIDTGNVGFVLDSWHWWNAGETADDILALQGSQVVAVDLNDAPAGIPKEKQIDGQRELPLATGVIDVKPFLNALHKIGYDGPVRAEPFNRALNDLDNDGACAKTAQALRKAFELIDA